MRELHGHVRRAAAVAEAPWRWRLTGCSTIAFVQLYPAPANPPILARKRDQHRGDALLLLRALRHGLSLAVENRAYRQLRSHHRVC